MGSQHQKPLWLLVNQQSSAHKIARFQEEARNLSINLECVDVQQFEILQLSGENQLLYSGVPLKQLPGAVLSLVSALMVRGGEPDLLFQLEQMGVPVVNGTLPRAAADSKLRTHQLLAAAHLPTPDTLLLKEPVNYDCVRKTIGYPLVLKPNDALKGMGVMLCETEHHLRELVGLVRAVGKPGAQLLAQKLVAESTGKDVRVLVLNGVVLGAMQRQGTPGSLAANVAAGGSVSEFALPESAGTLALQAAHTIGLEYVGVDLLFSEKGFQVCEVNANPGFEGFEKATGVNVARAVLAYMQSLD